MPFELRPSPAPTLRPDGPYLQTAWKNSVYPLARRMGVEIRLPSVTPQPYTRLAFEGLEFAKKHGAGGGLLLPDSSKRCCLKWPRENM